MSISTVTKSFNARLPEELYMASQHVAQVRGVSMNTLVQEALARVVREQEEQEFYDSFTLLGQDTAANDVGFAFDAQAEIADGA